MNNQLFDAELAVACLDVFETKVSEEEKLLKMTQAIAHRIEIVGRESNGMPTMAAVLEERVNLSSLTTIKKLIQVVDIIEFMNFMDELRSGMPTPMPDIMKKAAERVPEIHTLLAPHRKILN